MTDKSKSAPPSENSTSPDKTTPPDEVQAQGLLVEEMKHRRDKEWKIFAWTTRLLAGGKRARLLTGYILTLALIFATTLVAIFWVRGSEAVPEPAAATWYFAVSGDSRDCGDLIMPKIAQSIADHRSQAPVEFYWHLGDLRAIYRPDCDWVKRKDPSAPCPPRFGPNPDPLKAKYLSEAWPDFRDNALQPFEAAGIQVFLGIGNHEVIAPRTRSEFRDFFRKWLTQPILEKQRQADASRQDIFSKDGKSLVPKQGETYFHFRKANVDFIYLDNSDVYVESEKDRLTKQVGFSKEQLDWLRAILKADAADPQVKTIIVGMHAALPYSISSDHAMDNACKALCNGSEAYDLLLKAQRDNGKRVYVMASHAHFFEADVYNTPALKGKVLPGWIIGTAGAEQYKQNLLYGYLLAEVRPDGSIATSFVSVDRNSPPTGQDSLARYCFEDNKRQLQTTTAAPSPTPPCPACGQP